MLIRTLLVHPNKKRPLLINRLIEALCTRSGKIYNKMVYNELQSISLYIKCL